MKVAIYLVWAANIVRDGVRRSVRLNYGYIALTLYYAKRALSTTVKAGKMVQNFGAGLDLQESYGIIKSGKR